MALLVAVGGALLGSTLGIGANIGWIVGAVIGQLLFPTPGTTVEGPRMQDLSVTSSAYGAPRSIGYGRIRVAGNVIWAKKIREQKKKKKVGGKGFGGGQTQITYSYFGTWAVAFGEGPATKIQRIWADSKLVYDARGYSGGGLAGIFSSSNTKKKNWRFKFYNGTTSQLQNALMVAREGATSTPAYRSTVYVVFDDCALKDFGNRIPNITAEIIYKSDVARDIGYSALESGMQTANLSGTVFGIDWTRKKAYYAIVGGSDPAGTYIQMVNINNGTVEREAAAIDILDQTTDGASYFSSYDIVCTDDGALHAIVISASGSNSRSLVRLDPVTLAEVDRFGTPSGALVYTPTGGLPTTSKLAKQRVSGGTGGTKEYILASPVKNGLCFGLYSSTQADGISYVYDDQTAGLNLQGTDARAIAPGRRGDGVSEMWVLTGPNYEVSASTGNLYLYKITITSSANYSVVNSNDTYGGVSAELYHTFAPTDLSFTVASSWSECDTLTYDATDDSLIMHARTNSSDDYLFKFDIATKTFAWETAAIVDAPNRFGTSSHKSRLEGYTFGMVNGNRSWLVDTRSGVLLENATETNWSIAEDGLTNGAYDGVSESFVGIVANGASQQPMVRYFFNRVSASDEDLSDVVQDLCTRAGMEASDVVVSGLASSALPGYFIGRQTTARAAIEQLANVYLFDGYESDFTLNFKLRGSASSARTIVEDDLAILDNDTGDIYKENRAQEVELPNVMSLTYMDITNDYQQQTHSAKRITFPNRSQWSENKLDLSLPASLNQSFAKRQAEKLLYASWLERSNLQFRWTWEHLDLDPGDVVTITLDNGTTYQGRLISYDVGDGYTIDATIVAEKTDQYLASEVTADAGAGFVAQNVVDEYVVQTFIVDSPLLRDADDTLRTTAPIYIWQGAISDGGLGSGSIYYSTDNETFTEMDWITEGVEWGSTVNALGDPPWDSPFMTDNTNTLNVRMVDGGDILESITESEWLAGGNAALLLKNNGEVECINFQDVLAESNGSYTLSKIRRGLRGTDTMAWNHTAGEKFLYLSSFNGRSWPLPLSAVDTEKYYLGLGNGQLFENGDHIALTSEGRSLMPYAPTNIRASLSGSDIVFTWTRRDRLRFDLRSSDGSVDTSEAPLSEDSESYKIEILDGENGSVLRTDATLTSETYTYTAANISTDFGTTPSTIYINLYQVSAQVGNGFAYASKKVDVY